MVFEVIIVSGISSEGKTSVLSILSTTSSTEPETTFSGSDFKSSIVASIILFCATSSGSVTSGERSALYDNISKFSNSINLSRSAEL